MKKSIKNIFASTLIAGALAMSGCTNLDETLYDTLSDENIDLNKENDMAAMVGHCVTTFRYIYLQWFGYNELQEEGADTYCIPKRIGVGWGDLYVNLHKHNWTYTLSHADALWSSCYTCIGYCNQVLDVLDPESVTAAQARFFRATCYWILFDAFRDVPFMDTADVEPGYLPQQIGAQAMYDFIEKEYLAIKDVIGERNGYGWGNKYAAEMFLARLYLNKNVYLGTSGNDGYQAALALVNDVINNGGYTLSENYLDNTRENMQDNTEIIFAIPEDRTHATHFQICSIAFPQTGLDAYASSAGAWNGSCAVPQFIDSYAIDDKRLDYTWAHGEQHYAVKNADGTYTNNAGDPIPFEADDWSGTGILNYSKAVHSMDNPGAYQQEGYRIHRFEIVNGTNNGTYADDYPVLRLAEAYFIKAECLLRLGQDKQTAADLITAVRKRSFDSLASATRTIADLEGPSQYPYGIEECTSEGATNWADWNRRAEGGADIELGGLLDDYAWEFIGESQRRTHMIRFKMKDGRSVWTGKSWFCKEGTSDKTYEIFAIPESAMRTNLTLKQNPGYPSGE